MVKRILGTGCLLYVLGELPQVACAHVAQSPNVVVVMADDLGYADYEWLKGNPNYKEKHD